MRTAPRKTPALRGSPAAALILLAACLCLAASGRARAGDPEEPGWLQPKLQGVTAELKVRYFAYLEEGGPGSEDQFGDGQALINLPGRLGRGLRYLVSPQFRADTQSLTSARVELREDGPGRPAFTFQEAYVAYTGEVYEVILGKVIYNWGVADGVNPVDNLNPLASLDVPSATKIGVSPPFPFSAMAARWICTWWWSPFSPPAACR